jgi:Plasmid pRiA4b ORF-3-like protein
MRAPRASSAGAPPTGAPAAGGATHILRASLKPKLYRDIEIESTASLRTLAEAIVMSFDFDFDHAFGFYSKLTERYHESPERYELFADTGDADPGVGSVEKTAVAKAFQKVGKKMLFLFDYGDDWRFTVELVKLGQKKPATRYPRLLVSSGTAPEQYPEMDED